MSRNPRASIDGLEQIDQARIAKKLNKLDEQWFEAVGIAQKTLSRFWDRERLRKPNFVGICEAVGVDWTLVVDPELLTTPQEKQLVEALTPICPETQALESLLQHECGIRLSDLRKSLKTQALTLRKVIDWLGWVDSPTKLLGLIIGAARYNPQHQRLQTFILEHLEVVFAWSGWDFEPSTPQLTRRLWEILLQLNAPTGIGAAFQDTVGRDRLAIHAADREKQDLRFEELVTGLNLYRLLDFLLHRYPYHGESQTPNLLIFAQKLCHQLEQQHHHCVELQSWCQVFQAHCGCEPPPSCPEPIPVVPERTYQDAVLMVCVEGEPGQSPPQRFRLMPYLQAYYTHAETVTAQPLGRLNSNPAQRYDYDACAVKEQVTASMVSWIRESLTKIQTLKSAAGSQLELRIEVFLPYTLLDWAVDLTEIDAKTKKSLGTAYKVVGRSYERYADLMIAYEFTKAWDDCYQPCHPATTPNLNEHNHIESIEKTSEITLQKCSALCANVDHKWVLKMTCPPPADLEQKQTFFYHLVTGTIPVMFWTRCNSLKTVPHWPQSLDPFVTWEQVTSRSQLLETVRQERAKAYGTGQPQDHLGHYLAVLYDDPNVRPEVAELRE